MINFVSVLLGVNTGRGEVCCRGIYYAKYYGRVVEDLEFGVCLASLLLCLGDSRDPLDHKKPS